jgi:hypothetical protein
MLPGDYSNVARRLHHYPVTTSSLPGHYNLVRRTSNPYGALYIACPLTIPRVVPGRPLFATILILPDGCFCATLPLFLCCPVTINVVCLDV